jgi:Tol biopolymer transport system component
MPLNLSRTMVLLAALGLALPGCNWIARGSVATDGAEGNASSGDAKLSADGRYVAFSSSATNLVADDTNGIHDFFQHDVLAGTTTRLTVATDGSEANDVSYGLSMSGDGRYVVFRTSADNLVPADSNSVSDIFLRDTVAGTTELVSLTSGGAQANHGSLFAALSADGHVAVFTSYASNLVAGDTNDAYDIFVRDLQTGTTTRVSVASDGTEGNEDSRGTSALSADGRYVAFSSGATNLVAADFRRHPDIFLHDRQGPTTTRISVGYDGFEANEGSYGPVLSADGRYLAYHSYASNLVEGDTNGRIDVFLHDTQSGETTRISAAPDGGVGGGQEPAMSADGRWIAFDSNSSDHVAVDSNGFNDVFLHDTLTGLTSLASVSAIGVQATASSQRGALSADGRYVAFGSDADNLVPADTNGASDIFTRAVPRIEVTAVIPDHLPVGATTPVTITGTNFLPGVFPNVGGFQLSSVAVVDENTITANVIVPVGTPTGARSVSVSRFGTGPGPITGAAGFCTNCVTIQ